MGEGTQSGFDKDLERFARGELNSAEARELAQTSLVSLAWFEELTATALAKTAVSSVRVPEEPVRHAWWRSPLMLVAASGVAAVIVFSVYFSQTQRKGTHPPPVAKNGPVEPSTFAKPTLSVASASSQPVLLADDLQDSVRSQSAQVFRGEEQAARAPRQTGSIISIEDGLATVDLGSLDGLEKGSELNIIRDRVRGERIGQLRIETVFREQARGPFSFPEIKIGYAVRVNAATHARALLQQVDALQSQGQLSKARQAAAEASTWAETASLTGSGKATILAKLAQLDFQAGDLASANTHFRGALDQLESDPHASAEFRARTENDIAALAILRGDDESAQKLLQRAEPLPDSERVLLLNNLGVLAEIRGDHEKAESYYSQALKALSLDISPQERQIVEANLARTKGPH